MGRWLKAWLSAGLPLASLLLLSATHAGEFFTIIGPDGRPLVVPANNQVNESKAKTATQIADKNTSSVSAVAAPKPEQPAPTNATSQQAIVVPTPTAPTITPQTALAQSNTAQSEPVKALSETRLAAPSTATSPVQSTTNQATLVQQSPPKPQNTPQAIASTVPQAAAQQPAGNASNTSAFTVIDGQQYVNNEYLEQKEFNLEDKKRFYVMPEGVIDKNGNAVRLRTIEREKGVNRSFLDKVLARDNKADTEKTLVLASTYYRMSKSDVETTLEQSCFSGKKFKKPKELLSQDELALFPKPPLKDIFDYELVKLSDTVQNVKITSYAASDVKPTFYWPFVVFLNEQGCVIEGVSGFKTEQLPATMLQHTAIQGLIKLPVQTRYLLMTPQATALDVDASGLSNQGQITLTAIR